VRNTGNMHVQPKLVAEILNKSGEKTYKIFDANIRAIMPGETWAYSTYVPVQNATGTINGAVSVFFHNADGGVEKAREEFTIQ